MSLFLPGNHLWNTIFLPHKTHPQLIYGPFQHLTGKYVRQAEYYDVPILAQTVRDHTPILKEVEKSQTHFTVPWLGGKSVGIIWTA